MSKIWQIRPKIEEDFIKKYLEYDRLTLQLLYNRGLTEKKEIEEFLEADYQKYKLDPFLFNDIEKAVELIINKVKAGEKIIVYGDYDADGVTATTVLLETLKTLKAVVDIYLPDRVSEGYSLNQEAIKEIAAGGAKLIITVDNGIRNKAEVAYARELGLEVIVTDHHVPPKEPADLPGCLIIDPIREEEKYPFKYLAGVGVAAKLAAALVRRAKLSPADKEKLEERFLDLTAIGTIADCVKLRGENRLLVKKGLEVLNKKNKRLGLLELIKAARINEEKKLDAWNISYQIAPRLNAAGRMDHANTAFELLNTKDREEAEVLARDLNEKNIERQRETEGIVAQIEKKIDFPQNERMIIAVSPSVYGQGEQWNEGVIGLAAARICDKYYLPVLVITGEGEKIKGSGRSIEEFNLIEATAKAAEFLGKYGGHAGAIGFAVKDRDSLNKFSAKLKRLASEQLKNLDLRPKLAVEAELELSEIDEALLSKLEKFAPFGEENERPIFSSRGAVILDLINLGLDGQHLKLRIKSEKSGVKTALAFGQAELWRDLKINDKIDLVYYVELNEFNGKREVQLKVVDIKKT